MWSTTRTMIFFNIHTVFRLVKYFPNPGVLGYDECTWVDFFFFVATRHSHNRTFSHRLRWLASTARGPPSWAERDWPCCLASRDYTTHSSRESTLGVYFCDIKPIVFFQMVFSSLHLHYTIIMLKTYLIKMSLKAN